MKYLDAENRDLVQSQWTRPESRVFFTFRKMLKDADSQDVNVNSVMINTTTIIGIVQVSKTCKGSDLDTQKKLEP